MLMTLLAERPKKVNTKMVIQPLRDFSMWVFRSMWTVSYTHLDVYKRQEYNNSNYTINLEVKRVYAIHNFKTGYLWIKYSVVVLDKTGNIMTSSKNIPVKLKIKKNKSNWEVIRIDEKEAYSNLKDFFDFWTI